MHSVGLAGVVVNVPVMVVQFIVAAGAHRLKHVKMWPG